jgi:hypothetical protein
VSGQFHAPSESAPSTQCVECWMDLRIGLDAVEKILLHLPVK